MRNMVLKETVAHVSLTSLSFRTSNKFQNIHTYIYINQLNNNAKYGAERNCGTCFPDLIIFQNIQQISKYTHIHIY